MTRTAAGFFTVLAALALTAAGQDPPPKSSVIRRSNGETLTVPQARPADRGRPAAPATGVLAPMDKLERRIFELTNAERRRHGLGPLVADDALAEVARRYSDDMMRRGFFSHRDPEGRSFEDRVARGHRRLVGTAGENIWSGSGALEQDPLRLAQTIVDAWMASPGHRDNILRPGFTHLGVGVAVRHRQVLATQNFATAWAFLDKPLPVRFDHRSPPAFSMKPHAARGAATLFALVDARSEERRTDPIPVGASELDVKPGIYRLRFFFPQEGGTPELTEYSVVPGPEVTIE